MDKLEVILEPRTVVGKKVKHLRTQGLLPASICGKSVESQNFVTNAHLFTKIYQQAGKNTLIQLRMPSGTSNAFIRQIQRHPINKQWIHVDFHVVDMRVPITADVPVVAVGDNQLLKGGFVNIVANTIHVRALPGDIPSSIEVDISGIEDYNTQLHVSDLKLDSNIEVLTPGDESLLSINVVVVAPEDEAPTEPAENPDPMSVNNPTKSTENE
ncbi:MAG: 50S ribosomal protein L25/general stress protein Ctc [Herpetosiphon sp.]